MRKCSICGKAALEVVEVCQECLLKSTIDPRYINKLRQINSILNVITGTDKSLKECTQSMIEITQDLERNSGNGEKKK